MEFLSGLFTIMCIFFLAIFLTSKLTMAEETKLEQHKQRETCIACSHEKLHEQVYEQLYILQHINVHLCVLSHHRFL